MSRKDYKTSQILDAAIDEFLAKGFDAASMQHISCRAMVSKRTLYKYFPSKEDLFSALIDESLDKIESIHEAIYQNEEKIEVQIANIIEKKIELITGPSFLRLTKIVFGELLKDRTPSQEQLARLAKSENLFTLWITQAQAQNKITTKISPEIIANQFHSILKGQIFWPLILNLKTIEEINIEEVKKTTLDFFIHSFTI